MKNITAYHLSDEALEYYEEQTAEFRPVEDDESGGEE